MTVDQIAHPPSYGHTTRVMRIVGVAVFPAFSRGTFTATDLGSGAAVPAAVLSAIAVTFLLALVIAAGPGWAAARISPATVLRAE